MEFSFYTANKIVFKKGALDDIALHVKPLGKKFMIVVDPFFFSTDTMTGVKKHLDEAGLDYVVYGEVANEPTVEQTDQVAELAIKEKCEAVISIGGGSCIDTGKATAALITNGTPAVDYMEYVGKGKKVTKQPVPFVSIPTTAGTGSEVTKNAVLGSHILNFKRSMRSDMMVANVTIVDPLLTVTCPKKVTANSGIDAATHLIESYITWRSTPISDGLSMSGIELVGKYLRRAYDDGNDIEAREGMSAAALIGGMSFANSGLGAAHGIGMAIGIAYGVPHGEACGIMLPHIMRLNAPHVETRMARIGELLTGKKYTSDKEASQAAIDFIDDLRDHMGIKPDFKHLNIPKEKIPELVKASFGTSMSSNPVQLKPEEWEAYFPTIV